MFCSHSPNPYNPDSDLDHIQIFDVLNWKMTHYLLLLCVTLATISVFYIFVITWNCFQFRLYLLISP